MDIQDLRSSKPELEVTGFTARVPAGLADWIFLANRALRRALNF